MHESTVAAAILAAGGSPDGYEGVGDLAVILLGDNCLLYGVQKRPAKLERDPWRIRVSVRLDDSGVTIAVAWGLALWWQITHHDVGDVDLDAVAEWIAVPDDELRAAILDFGEDVETLAEEFVCSQAVMGRRLRQLTGRLSSGLHAAG